MSQNKKSDNKLETVIGWIIGSLFFAFIIFCWLSCNGNIDCDSGPRGDGSSSCKNCGRKKVYALGYCKSCYNGFIDWYDRTYVE